MLATSGEISAISLWERSRLLKAVQDSSPVKLEIPLLLAFKVVSPARSERYISPLDLEMAFRIAALRLASGKDTASLSPAGVGVILLLSEPVGVGLGVGLAVAVGVGVGLTVADGTGVMGGTVVFVVVGLGLGLGVALS